MRENDPASIDHLTMKLARSGKLKATVLVAAVALASAAWPAGTAAPQGSVIYLVRHAETVGEMAMDPSDPPLSEPGQARAEVLARILADAGLTSIHSTDLQRTRATAAPIAAATGLEVQLYEPFDEEGIDALIERWRNGGGRHLVVGHSNTTPELVRSLGGDPVSPIAEDEYDRLYVVTVAATGEVVSTLLRYGDPSNR